MLVQPLDAYVYKTTGLGLGKQPVGFHRWGEGLYIVGIGKA